MISEVSNYNIPKPINLIIPLVRWWGDPLWPTSYDAWLRSRSSQVQFSAGAVLWSAMVMKRRGSVLLWCDLSCWKRCKIPFLPLFPLSPLPTVKNVLKTIARYTKNLELFQFLEKFGMFLVCSLYVLHMFLDVLRCSWYVLVPPRELEIFKTFLAVLVARFSDFCP